MAQTKDCLDGNELFAISNAKSSAFQLLKKLKSLNGQTSLKPGSDLQDYSFPAVDLKFRNKCNAYLLSPILKNANFFQRVNEIYIARKNICPCSHLKNKTKKKRNKAKKYLSCKNCKRFQTRSGEFLARRSREKGARACRSQGTEKSGKSSTFVWTGAALARDILVPRGRAPFGMIQEEKNKTKKKKTKKKTDRDHNAQITRFGRLHPPQLRWPVQNIRYENHFPAIIHKQTKIFISEYHYVINLFVRKENKEVYFEAQFVNSYLMVWLFRLKLSQAERNSWWICKPSWSTKQLIGNGWLDVFPLLPAKTNWKEPISDPGWMNTSSVNIVFRCHLWLVRKSKVLFQGGNKNLVIWNRKLCSLS